MSAVIPDPSGTGGFLIGDATDSDLGFHLGAMVLTKVHSADACAGRACVIHAPSDHQMRNWPLTWRGDRGLMERRCAHGIGHPDPDDMAYHVSQGNGWQGVHGCDGCCRKEGAA